MYVLFYSIASKIIRLQHSPFLLFVFFVVFFLGSSIDTFVSLLGCSYCSSHSFSPFIFAVLEIISDEYLLLFLCMFSTPYMLVLVFCAALLLLQSVCLPRKREVNSIFYILKPKTKKLFFLCRYAVMMWCCVLGYDLFVWREI